MTLTPDAQQRSKWPTEAQIEGLRQFVEWHGAAHTEDCPADDTCGCVCKPLNDAVNSILSESFDRDVVNDDIAALQARLDALHQQLQDVETERDRQTDCALQSQAALQRERDKFDALHQEQEQLRQENQALLAALRRIEDDDTGGCRCEHDDENCCAFAPDYCCPFCIAAVALKQVMNQR